MTVRQPVLALIDGDILIYQATAATEHPIDWGNGLWTLHGFLEDAIAQFEDTMLSIIRRLSEHYKRPVRALFALSDRERNFRKEFWPEYKANRQGKRSPLCRWPLYDYVSKNHTVITYPRLEADDVLGIYMTKDDGEDKVIVSIDKDLKTIPGEHYDFGKDEFFTVTDYDAVQYHLIQTLTGDTADGYPGCPGIGPIRAEKLIKDCETFPDAWSAIIGAYEKAGQSEGMALIMARLAYILQAPDYDIATEKVRLWNPARKLIQAQ